MKIRPEELRLLMSEKLKHAGLTPNHANMVADVLLYADIRGIHSHGAVRVEYYAERIYKGGITADPAFNFVKTGPCSAIFHADNASGHVAAQLAMEQAIDISKEQGVAVVGVRQMAHSGALAYFVEQAAKEGLVAISVCQSDPMVVPFGGAEPYYGTNPIAFAAPGVDDDMISFDMATTVQAWGKVLDARSKSKEIPETWAVNKEGQPTSNPFDVRGLLPIAGPKGYCLMMMIDVLSGVLLGLPFGKHVSSMYQDLSKGRYLGQLHIVINPANFTDAQQFKNNISQVMKELHSVKPAPGFENVLYPGENLRIQKEIYERDGIEIVDHIYDYLCSDQIYINSYETNSCFIE